MTGQQAILAMRRSGRKPQFVWISDFQNPCFDGLTVGVFGDTPELEDFRFLVGVTAIVEGPDAKRVERITNACKTIAHRVIASTCDLATSEITRITDTEGEMSWPE